MQDPIEVYVGLVSQGRLARLCWPVDFVLMFPVLIFLFFYGHATVTCGGISGTMSACILQKEG